MENEMSDERSREVEETIKKGRLSFAIKCLHKVLSANQNKSFVFSPPCLYDALFLTHFLIRDAISERLKEILCLGIFSKTDFMNYCSYKKSRGKEWMTYSENCINNVRCWINQHLINIKNIQPTIAKTISYFFDNPMIDSKMYINCKAQIKHVNELLNRPVEGLINERITLPDDKQDIILMTSISDKFNYAEPAAAQANYRSISYFYPELNIHVTVLSYQNADFSLFIFAPASIIEDERNKRQSWRITENISHTDLSEFTKRLSTMDGVRKLRKVLKTNLSIDTEMLETTANIVHVLPFEVEKDLTIRELLETLNVPLLTSEMIELDIISGDSPRVQIRNAVHRSHIKATNEEVVVRAMTLISSIGENPPSNPNIVDVNCNNPVIWMIYNTKHEEILYVGSCNNAEPVTKSKPKPKSVSVDVASSSDCPPSKKRRIDESS